MTKHTRLVSAALAALAVSAVPNLRAEENDILLKVLVRKGVLTESEAADVRAEVAKEKAKQAKAAPATASVETGIATKLDISKSVEKLKLSGDLRLRYQYDARDSQFEPGVGVDNDRQRRSSSGTQDSRFRFRLRLNADYQFTDNLFAGVELQTNQANDSANQNFENGFNDYDIFISRAYMGWDPAKWLRLVGGKMPTYFYNTDLMWDPDINPTGVFESIAFHKLSEESEESLSKDGKTISTPVKKPWELTLNAGQFLFDNNPEGAFDNDSNTDAWLFYTQMVGTFHFNHGPTLTVAPGYMTYVNGSASGVINARGFNDNDNVSGATRNLNLLLLPGDIGFKIGDLKAKFFWDISYNIEGRKRVEDIYNLVALDSPENDPDDLRKGHSNVDDLAFLVGMKIGGNVKTGEFGDNKKAGDWSLSLDYRQVGLGAVDPNLNDSDVFASALNMRGFRVKGDYNFTDFLTAGFSYTYGWNLRQTLLTDGEALFGNAVADTNDIHTAIFDLQIKF